VRYCIGTGLAVSSDGGQKCPLCERPVTAYLTRTGYALPMHAPLERAPDEAPEVVANPDDDGRLPSCAIRV
jgi:hypothetical protein